jgi:hypothetical protein
MHAYPAVGGLQTTLTYSTMFRWFVGLSMGAPVRDVTVFTKSRKRLLQGDIAAAFWPILGDPQVKPLLSDEHFSVDAPCTKPGPA